MKCQTGYLLNCGTGGIAVEYESSLRNMRAHSQITFRRTTVWELEIHVRLEVSNTFEIKSEVFLHVMEFIALEVL